MNLEKWFRVSFLGWEVEYRLPGEMSGHKFTSQEGVGQDDPEKVKAAILERDGNKEIVSLKRVWIEPTMQFDEAMAQTLQTLFPEHIQVRSYQDWKQERKVGVSSLIEGAPNV